jgi:hypothetical protein
MSSAKRKLDAFADWGYKGQPRDNPYALAPAATSSPANHEEGPSDDDKVSETTGPLPSPSKGPSESPSKIDAPTTLTRTYNNSEREWVLDVQQNDCAYCGSSRPSRRPEEIFHTVVESPASKLNPSLCYTLLGLFRTIFGSRPSRIQFAHMSLK